MISKSEGRTVDAFGYGVWGEKQWGEGIKLSKEERKREKEREGERKRKRGRDVYREMGVEVTSRSA